MQDNTTDEQLLIKITEVVEVVKDIREFMPRTVKPKAYPPQHGDANWVTDYLEISESTFYRNVRGKLIEPVLRIGAREYYDREEVYDLLRRSKETRRSVGFLARKQQEEASASFFVPLSRRLGTHVGGLGAQADGVGSLATQLWAAAGRKRPQVLRKRTQTHRLTPQPMHQRPQPHGKRSQSRQQWGQTG